MSMNISLLTEIPEELHESLQNYLETHPTWDQDGIFAAALSLFLSQQGHHSTEKASSSKPTPNRIYLETLLQQ